MAELLLQVGDPRSALHARGARGGFDRRIRRAREWRFAVLTSIVLLELLASAVAALVFNRRL